MCASLAEICHVYPVPGGQYDWTYMLSPKKYAVGLSYFVGWMASAAWVSLVATGSSLGANFVVGIISLWSENYVAQRYQIFLIYVGFTIGAFLLNAFAVRLLPLVDKAAFYWSLAGIVVVIITVLAVSSPNYESAEFVFTRWVNETGWPDGVCFILGLLQSTFGLTGFDAISHMIEEMPNPAINAPKVMVLAVLLGSFTSWIFIVVLLFVLKDFDLVISAPTGPLLQIYYQAVNNRAGATCLLMFNVGAMAFATQGLLTVASRLVRAFARDRGLAQASTLLVKVHPTLKVPFWSVLFCSIWTIIFGLIFLGSSVALNAILSASVVFIQLSYIVPIALVVFRGRKILDVPGFPPRTLTLGAFGYVINIFALIFALVTTVFFVFPPAIPVTSGTTMNWVIVVVFVVFIMMAIAWAAECRKTFTGPKNIDALLLQSRLAAQVARKNH